MTACDGLPLTFRVTHQAVVPLRCNSVASFVTKTQYLDSDLRHIPRRRDEVREYRTAKFRPKYRGFAQNHARKVRLLTYDKFGSKAGRQSGNNKIRPRSGPEHWLAERVGFEPTDHLAAVTFLAGRPVRPYSGTSPGRPIITRPQFVASNRLSPF